MSLNVYEVLRRPLITEKNTMLADQHKFTFEVAREANTTQVKVAVEQLFNVNVVKVNVINVRGKMKRVGKSRGMSSNWKKAIVTLRDGEKIDVFEGG